MHTDLIVRRGSVLEHSPFLTHGMCDMSALVTGAAKEALKLRHFSAVWWY